MEFLLVMPLVVTALAVYSTSAFFSGWRELHRLYPDTTRSDSWRVASDYSVNLGGAAYYTGVMRLGLSVSGIRLSIIPILRLYHPPIFIPWKDVTECSPAQFPVAEPLSFYRRKTATESDGAERAGVVRLRVSKWPRPIYLYSFFGKHRHIPEDIMRCWEQSRERLAAQDDRRVP